MSCIVYKQKTAYEVRISDWSATCALPISGVTAVDGRFQRGDLVRVVDIDGSEIAVGLSAYAAEDARRILGHKSGDIAGILGYRGRAEIKNGRATCRESVGQSG